MGVASDWGVGAVVVSVGSELAVSLGSVWALHSHGRRSSVGSFDVPSSCIRLLVDRLRAPAEWGAVTPDSVPVTSSKVVARRRDAKAARAATATRFQLASGGVPRAMVAIGSAHQLAALACIVTPLSGRISITVGLQLIGCGPEDVFTCHAYDVGKPYTASQLQRR